MVWVGAGEGVAAISASPVPNEKKKERAGGRSAVDCAGTMWMVEPFTCPSRAISLGGRFGE